jgi:hypothetical protein
VSLLNYETVFRKRCVDLSEFSCCQRRAKGVLYICKGKEERKSKWAKNPITKVLDHYRLKAYNNNVREKERKERRRKEKIPLTLTANKRIIKV